MKKSKLEPRVCLVRHRQYPSDGRIANQVQALLDAGYEVDILCIRGPGEAYHSRLENGAHVYRLPSPVRKRGSKLRYIAEYVLFFLSCLLGLLFLQIRRKYSLVHICNLPDFLVFAAIFPKMLGAKIILDFRECTPERYHIEYGVAMDSALMKALVAIEQNGIRFVDAAVTCTEQMRHALEQRGANPDKISVMLNAINPKLFKEPILPDPAGGKKETFRLVIHGTIIKRYGHDILIRAMIPARKAIPGACLEIMGHGDWQPELERLVETLGLEKAVSFAGFLPHNELINRLRAADVGIVPMPQNIETDLIHTLKMQEYMALGIPVIISRTKAVEAYYDDESVYYFEPGNEESLARAIITLYNAPSIRYNLAKNALKAYENYAAPKQMKIYANLVHELLNCESSDNYEHLWNSKDQTAQ